MKPWKNMEISLEEILKKIVISENKSIEIQAIGDCLIANILICKEIENQINEEVKNKTWNEVKNELRSIEEDINKYLKENKICQ